ncbi:MAG: hypothetical protein ACREPT_01715, partial [Rudaea sp.]
MIDRHAPQFEIVLHLACIEGVAGGDVESICGAVPTDSPKPGVILAECDPSHFAAIGCRQLTQALGRHIKYEYAALKIAEREV